MLRTAPLEQKPKHAMFFTTSNEVINRTINIINMGEIQDKLILEPCSGNGMLILELMKKFHNFYRSKIKMDNFLQNNLIFNDINNDVLNECITNIKELYYRIYNTEINYPLNAFSVDFANSEKALKIYQYLNKIDYIIGNAPKIEFIEHTLDFLNKAGSLSFILDISFNKSAYKHTRENLLNNYKINEIVYNIFEFAGIKGEKIILKISKIKDDKDVKIINYQTKEEDFKNPLDLQSEATEFKFLFKEF